MFVLAVQICLAQTAATTSAPAGGDDIVLPVPKNGIDSDPTLFGDAVNVKLLAELTHDADPLIREQAIRDLGQTHNIQAEPIIRQALSDEDDDVRCAAVQAAAALQQGNWASIVQAGIKDRKAVVVLTALRIIRLVPLPSAGDAVVESLANADSQVQAQALVTLTSLHRAATQEKLASLLKSDSISVRMFAADNAALLAPAAGTSLVKPLTAMAQNDVPAARASALASLGRLAYDASRPLFVKAAGDSNPLIRRGAVQAAANAGKADAVKPFLDDPSAMMRLAAITACGKLKIQDSVGKLFELMCAAPLSIQGSLTLADDITHQAAQLSLRQIGDDTVAAAAAGKLAEQYKLLQDVSAKVPAASAARDAANKAVAAAIVKKDKQAAEREKAARQQLVDADRELAIASSQAAKATRNIRTACRILGDLKSDKGFEQQLAMAKALRVESEIFIDMAYNWGVLPQHAEESVPLLRANLAILAQKAPASVAEPPPVNLPYSKDVVVAEVVALGKLGDVKSLPVMKAFLSVTIKGTGRLGDECEGVMRAVGFITDPAVSKEIGRMVMGVLTDRRAPYSESAVFEAVKSAAKLDLKEASPVLEKIVSVDRNNRAMMQLAAWAYHRLTGKALTVGDPKANEGDWIIKKAK